MKAVTLSMLSRIGPCLAAALLLSTPGCSEPVASVAHRQDAATRKEAPQPKVVGYATLQGRVTYKAKDPPAVTKIKPMMDVDKFPAEVTGAGWYVDGKTQGVRYVLVFLKPAQGFKMLVAAEAQKLQVDKEGKAIETVQIGSPKGQFHPRVVSLHPLQKLEIVNNSDPPVNCDANVLGAQNAFSAFFKPGDKFVWDLAASDREPNRVFGSVYNWKSAYVWKMTHPYAVPTDAEGRFELKHVPVLPGDQKLALWVWHEMLPDRGLKEIGPLELFVNQVLVKNFTLPD